MSDTTLPDHASAHPGVTRPSIDASITWRTGRPAPEVILEFDGQGLIVACGQGTLLRLLRIQFPGKRAVAVREAIASGKPTLVNAIIDSQAGTESGRIGNLNPQSVVKKK